MQHVSEEDLILHQYGEGPDPAAVRAHLAECPACRDASDSLRRVLAAVSEMPVPERDAAYGRAVCERLRRRLPLAPPRARVVAFRRWAAVGAIAASLVLAFLLGRHTRAPLAQVAQPIPQPARERVLLVAVGDHLDRSQMVLVELINAKGNGTVDIASEQRWAEELVSDNRLYRQTAAQAGETGVATVLDDLERVLLEIAHSPSSLTAGELDALRERIEAQGILFKVKVIGSRVREREKDVSGRFQGGRVS
jgi:anti-sigma factor RsiW